MHDGKMVISSFDHVRNLRLMLFIRLNKTATNVENGRSERTTVPDPDSEIRRGWGQSSNSVFERRTSTGSGLFASLGSGLVETLG